MFCIGLTGNIASGKSTISQLFHNLGIVVISADIAARKLTGVEQPAFMAIKQHFGQSVLKASGELDRSKLRKLIFEDSKERVWLENLLHPLIRQYLQNELKLASGPYSIIEIPLLYDRSDYPYLDRVLLVLAHPELQIERVMMRDKCSQDEAQAMLKVQANEASRQKLADDIIDNVGSLEDLTKKIEILHERYLQFASQKS